MPYHHHNFISWLFPFEHFNHGHVLVGTLSLLTFALILFALFLFATRKQPRFQKAWVITSFFSLFLFASVAYAMCPVGFVPPGRIYHPDNNTRGLLVFANNLERLILEPSFTGNAKEFGLVMPTPNKPELKEAPKKIFQELEDLTNPIVIQNKRDWMFESSIQAPSDGVVIIEQKDVGDYTATVLTAESANALTKWLDDNGYRYNPNDKANFDYYVQKGGFYFVALKVNMAKAKVDANGFLAGRLRPIEFSFASAEPMLPIRSMAGEMDPMNFTLYTLAETPYYIPGSEVLYSKQLTSADLNIAPTLNEYQASGKWLVRNNVRFDPKQITRDLNLSQGGNKLVIPSVSQRRKINPHLTPVQSGIVETKTANAAYVGGTTATPGEHAFSRNLSRGTYGNDVKLLQIMLRDNNVYPEGLITGYFGPLTYKAVVRFQELNRNEILSPLSLSYGTGFVGSMTRSVLNNFASLE